MTKECEYFLSIIKDYICGIKTDADDTVDWQIVFDYAQSHQLTAIIYHQCKEFIPSNISDPFKSASLATVYSNTNRRNITEGVFSLLENNGIGYFLIKGFDIAEYYPNWQYRSMGDTDIVVDDLEKAHLVLMENGFQNISKNKDREYQYIKQNLEFELHDRLIYEETINLDSTTAFLNDYKNYVIDDRLDDSFHFIFILNHLRKHFMNSGVGFRQFVDIAVLVKNDTKIDWNWVEVQLVKIGLFPFAKTVFYYIKKWFGVTSPIQCEEISEDVFKNSTNYIFANGVFGFENDNNKKHVASNIARKSKIPVLSMTLLALKKVFPNYESLISSKHYLFLRNKPILLPVAWIYRYIRGIKDHRVNEGTGMIANSFTSKKSIAKREELYRNWGLSDKCF